MSAIFNGTSSYGNLASAIASAAPVFVSCWVKPANTTDSGAILNIGDTDDGSQFIRCLLSQTAETFEAWENDGGTLAQAVATGAYVASVWQHYAALFLGTSRHVWRDGAYKGSEGTTKTQTSLDMTQLGCRTLTGTPGLFLNGKLSTLAVWAGGNVTANASQLDHLVQDLAKGWLPDECGYVDSSALVLFKQWLTAAEMPGDVDPGFEFTDLTHDAADNPPTFSPGGPAGAVVLPVTMPVMLPVTAHPQTSPVWRRRTF